MGWDEVCVLSAIRPGGGPISITDDPDSFVRDMAAEISASGQTKLSDDELKSVLMKAIQPTKPQGIILGLPGWLSSEQYDWPHANVCIAIGHFNADGFCPVDGSLGWDKLRFPTGKGVEVRRVSARGADSGRFHKMLSVNADGQEIIQEQDTECSALAGKWYPNFFLLEACYRYLEEWLECSVDPRASGTGEPLPFVEELYEIVNSRKEPRKREGLPALDYGIITKTHVRWQDHFDGARDGSAHTAAAIAAGLRGVDLLPAILRDCQSWLFVRPDIWPLQSCTSSLFSSNSSPVPSQPSSSGLLGDLPTELFILILSQCSIATMLAVACTSKTVRATLMAEEMINRILKEMITYGPLRWIRPVSTLAEEPPRADEAMSTWLPSDVDGQSTPPLSSRHFPCLAFVEACYASDSMRNRRRLWGMVKQFDVLWRNYRVDGYERDEFIHDS